MVIGVGALAVVATVGYDVSSHLGLVSSPAELVATVQALGWRGHTLFLVLVTFRQFLAIPAGLILAVGGLCFGAALGTLLGAARARNATVAGPAPRASTRCEDVARRLTPRGFLVKEEKYWKE